MKNYFLLFSLALCFSIQAMEQVNKDEELAAQLAMGDRLQAETLIKNPGFTFDPHYKNPNLNETLFQKALEEGYKDIVLWFIKRFGSKLIQQDIDAVKAKEWYEYQIKKAISDWQKEFGQQGTGANGINVKIAELLEKPGRSAQEEAANLIKTGQGTVDPNYKYGNTTIFESTLTNNPIIMVALIERSGDKLSQLQIEKVKNASVYSFSESLRKAVSAWEGQYGKKVIPSELTLQEVKDRMSDLLDNKNIIGALNLFKKFNQVTIKEAAYAPIWSGAAFAAALLDPSQPNVLGTKADQEDFIKEMIRAAGKNFNYNLKDTQRGGTLLHWIAHYGNVYLLKLVLEELKKSFSQNAINKFINEQAKGGETPLFVAAFNYSKATNSQEEEKFKDIYNILLRNGAQDIETKNPLSKEMNEQPSKMIEKKDQGKQKPTDVTDQLIAAIEQNDIRGVEGIFTLKKNIDFNRPVKEYGNILQYAIAKGNELIVKLLVRFGAPVGDAEYALALQEDNRLIQTFIEDTLEKQRKPIIIIPPIGKGLEGALNSLSQRLSALAQLL